MSRFITVEGGEGAGKSTQIETIRAWLTERGHDVVLTREPGGTAVGERLRDVLLGSEPGEVADQAELLLMFAARAQLLEAVIRPALARGRTVLCDRFTDATFAYQGGGRELPMRDIERLQSIVHPDLQPDLTLLLDVDVAVGFERIGRSGRAADRIESASRAFFDRVRQTYLARAAAEPHRFAVVDAGQDEATVRRNVRAILEERLA